MRLLPGGPCLRSSEACYNSGLEGKRRFRPPLKDRRSATGPRLPSPHTFGRHAPQTGTTTTTLSGLGWGGADSPCGDRHDAAHPNHPSSYATPRLYSAPRSKRGVPPSSQRGRGQRPPTQVTAPLPSGKPDRRHWRALCGRASAKHRTMPASCTPGRAGPVSISRSSKRRCAARAFDESVAPARGAA